MDLLARLPSMDPAWSGTGVALAALVLALVLRGFLGRDERHRGRTTLVMLLLAVVLRLAVLATLDVPALALPTMVLRAAHVVALVLGLIGLASLIVFDLVLVRAGLRVPSILRNLLQGSVGTVVLLWLWREASGDLFSLVTTSAVLAILGLALQGTITNVFAGLSLQFEHSFQLGQWIQIDDQVGRILEVRWRQTSLITRDGDLVIVPNADLVGQRVLHLGGPGGAERVTVRIGFHYRHPPNLVRQVLVQVARETPGVSPFPEPDVVLLEFGDSAVVYGVRCWITDIEHEPVISSEVRTRIWYAARRAGLEIPFPIRTLVTPVDDGATRPTERAEHAATIASVELFSTLPANERELLAAGMHTQHFADGERILKQGEPGDSLYVVASGNVSVRLGVEGLEREVKLLAPGDVFGEMSLVTGEPRQASCVAVGDVVCRVVDRAAFRQLLDARPEVADEVSAVLARRQAELDGEREGLSAAARGRREAEARSRLLHRIRVAFGLD